MSPKQDSELEATVVTAIPEFPINQGLLEEATSIKEEWKVVRDRLEKIEASKEEVTPAVYDRTSLHDTDCFSRMNNAIHLRNSNSATAWVSLLKKNIRKKPRNARIPSANLKQR